MPKQDLTTDRSSFFARAWKQSRCSSSLKPQRVYIPVSDDVRRAETQADSKKREDERSGTFLNQAHSSLVGQSHKENLCFA